MTQRRSPSVPRYLLRLIVADDQRDAVIGDLEEEYTKRLHRFGLSATQRWYRREAASLILAFARQRLFERERPRAPRKVRPEMRALLNDLKFGFRALIKQPVSAAMSVLILAVGIGLSTWMFPILYGVFLRGLDLPQADRTIMVFETNLAEGDDKLQVPIHDFFEWRDNQRSFEGLFAWYQRTMNVSGTGENPQRFRGAYATGNLLDMLRVQPMMGRGFRAGDDDPGAPLVAVIGYEVWNGHFHGAEDVVGKNFKVNGRTATVIGVMPEDFGFPSGQQVWMPMTDRPADVERGERPLTVMGRLRDDVTMDQAQLELASIARGMEEQFPETNEGVGVRFLTFAQNATPLDNFGSVFVVMMAAGLLVLLAAPTSPTSCSPRRRCAPRRRLSGPRWERADFAWCCLSSRSRSVWLSSRRCSEQLLRSVRSKRLTVPRRSSARSSFSSSSTVRCCCTYSVSQRLRVLPPVLCRL